MTKDELISKVAERSHISLEDAEAVINAFTEEIKQQLINGEKVAIAGFGTFILSERKAKTFINPKTGEKHDLPDRKLPRFKAGGDFKKNIRK